MKKSPLDELYFEIYGEYPPKAGQAYERLVAAAFKLLLNEDVEYDEMLRGAFGNTMYQLDGLVNPDKHGGMVEAKDYTLDARKVGRSDIQKLQGAISDLAVEKGIFASATQYTAPATKYAQSSKVNPLHKTIDLFHIRPSTVEDEKGRLKKIIINMQMHVINYVGAKFQPNYTIGALSKLRENGYVDKVIHFKISQFHTLDGKPATTITELTGTYPPSTTWEDGFIAKGCWILNGECILHDNQLYPLNGLEYELQFLIHKQELVIEAEGSAKLYVQSDDGNIDKLVSDKDLKKVKFNDGKVIISDNNHKLR